MDNDTIDFKPITDGLGFHKKVIDIRDEHSSHNSSTLRPLSQPIQNRITAQPLQQTQAQSKQISKPQQQSQSLMQPQMPKTILPRAQTSQPAPGQMRRPQLWDPQLKNLDIIEKEHAPTSTLKPVANSLPAAFLDTLAVIGVGCFLSALVFAITTLEFEILRDIIFNELGSQVAMTFLFFFVHIIYAVASRTFFGKTLGEWAFDSQLGDNADQQRVIYPLLVAWRAILVAITGFVTLPILSLVMGSDVAGVFTGVSLYAEKK